MKVIAFFVPFLMLAACADPAPYQKEMEQVGSSRAVKVLTTEDGTTLWAFDPPNDSVVYFSSSGTTQNVGCGKGCVRSKVVSNSEVAPAQAEAEQADAPLTGRVMSQTTNPDGTVTVTIRP